MAAPAQFDIPQDVIAAHSRATSEHNNNKGIVWIALVGTILALLAASLYMYAFTHNPQHSKPHVWLPK